MIEYRYRCTLCLQSGPNQWAIRHYTSAGCDNSPKHVVKEQREMPDWVEAT